MPAEVAAAVLDRQQCPQTSVFAALRRLAKEQPLVALHCAGRLTGSVRQDEIQRPAFEALATRDPMAALRALHLVMDRPWIGDVGLEPAAHLARIEWNSQTALLLQAAVRRFPYVAIRAPELILDLPDGERLLREAIQAMPNEALGMEHLRAWRLARGIHPLPQFDAEQAALQARGGELPRVTFPQAAAMLRYLDGASWRRVWDRFVLAGLTNSHVTSATARELAAQALAQGAQHTLPSSLLQRAAGGIDNLEALMTAGAIADAYHFPAPSSPVTIWDRLFVDRYQNRGKRYFQPPRVLRLEDARLQRYFFYDDADGRESFAAFRRAYRDRQWQWQERPGYVVVTRGEAEIYANFPGFSGKVPLPRDPDVIVHRGHAVHLPATVPHIPHSARFVVLGSCRGANSVRDVLERAPFAQVLATRSTGTIGVNDPLLKQINDQLVAQKQIEWELFWPAAARRLQHQPLFPAYVPPHRNSPALLYQAYLRYLEDLSDQSRKFLIPPK